MAKTEENVKKSEEFIKGVLERNFKQKVKPKALKRAAEKLCAAIPAERKTPEARVSA